MGEEIKEARTVNEASGAVAVAIQDKGSIYYSANSPQSFNQIYEDKDIENLNLETVSEEYFSGIS